MLVQKDRLRRRLLMMGALVGLLALPSVSHGAYVITYGFVNSPELQGVSFAPPTTGTTITGNTNPPPTYDVSVTSLEGITLRGGGRNVTNNTNADAGFREVDIFNSAGVQWTYLDVQLDSLLATAPPEALLTISVFQGATLVATQTLLFPWEGNQGENQHYMVFATGTDWFNRVRIDYNSTTNTIQDMHHINVSSTIRLTVVPAPPSAVLAGAGVLTLGLFRLRRTWKGKAAV
jgi:hypothetical protein